MADHGNHPISSDDESRDRDLNRHRTEEQREARAELVVRLNDRGIEVKADDASEDVVELYEAIEHGLMPAETRNTPNNATGGRCSCASSAAPSVTRSGEDPRAIG